MHLPSLMISVFAFIAPVQAQTDDLLRQLVETSPDIAAAEAEAAAARAGVWEARGQALPQLSIQAQAGTIEETLRINGVPGEFTGTRDPAAATATVEQALFTSGRIGGAINASKAQAREAEHRLDAVRQDTVLAGAIVIADLVRDRAIETVRRDNAAISRSRLEESLARRREGLATETDVQQSRARLALAEADRIAAEAKREQSEASFVRLFGFPAPEYLDLPSAPEEQTSDLEEAITMALDANPELEASRDNQYAARHAVRAERGRLLPQISLNASAAYAENERFGVELGEAEQYQVSIQGRWELFSGGAGHARTRAASKRASAAENRTMSHERVVREQTVSAWSALASGRSVVASRELQGEAASSAAAGVLAEFRNGRRTRLDVLDADRENAEADVALLSARADLAVAQFRLLRVMGRL